MSGSEWIKLVTAYLGEVISGNKSFKTLDIYVKESDGIKLVEDMIVYSNKNIFPNVDGQFWMTCVMFVLGSLVMAYFLKIEAKQEK